MNSETTLPSFRAALAISAALIVSSALIAVGLAHIRSEEQSVTVTGSAKTRIKSDRVIWRAVVTANAPQLKDAYQMLTTSIPRVRDYLVKKGVPQPQIVASAITTKTIGRTSRQQYDPEAQRAVTLETGQIAAYELQQSLEVRSDQVDQITAIS